MVRTIKKISLLLTLLLSLLPQQVFAQEYLIPEEEVQRVFDCFGVQVINYGEDYLIILPSERLFHGNSPRMRSSAYPAMEAVVNYMRLFTKMSVRVEGYTDNQDVETRNIALSQARAERVAKYLWAGDVDARLLYAEGHGSAKPMANNETEAGQERNQRVEITFRRLNPYV